MTTSCIIMLAADCTQLHTLESSAELSTLYVPKHDAHNDIHGSYNDIHGWVCHILWLVPGYIGIGKLATTNSMLSAHFERIMHAEGVPASNISQFVAPTKVGGLDPFRNNCVGVARRAVASAFLVARPGSGCVQKRLPQLWACVLGMASLKRVWFAYKSGQAKA